MANSMLGLPTDKKDLADIIRMSVETSKIKRNFYKARWTLSLLYLQGIRNIRTIDWVNGSVSYNNSEVYFEDFPFRFEGIIPKYQTELGRLLQIDVAPVVKRRGAGLDGLKKASIGQLLLDDLVPPDVQNRIKEDMCKLLCQMGFVAIGTFPDKNGEPELQMIPPWEVLSIPSAPITEDQQSGLVRNRYVSESWLRELYSLQDEKLDWNDPLFRWNTITAGDDPNQHGQSSTYLTQMTSSVFGDTIGSSNNPNEKMERWTEMNEIWVKSPDNKLIRYMIMCGDKILLDQDMEGQDVPMPINVARYVDAGDFYGRGLVEQLMPLSIEIEYMLQNLFDNVQDYDQYGILTLTAQMGLDRNDISTARANKEPIFYTPDPISLSSEPRSIMPTNSGQMPSNIASLAMGMMETQSSQSELFSGGAPGRVDNARGLNFLYETANIPLSGPSESIARCIVGAYRSMLWQAKNLVTTKSRLINMTFSDDVLVGVVYDPGSGNVEIDPETIPDPNEVIVSIGSKTPKSDAQVKLDLDQNLQMGLITPQEYRIMAREQGLDVPVGNDREWNSYVKAKMENVVLYGDGESPGEINVSPYDFHQVHLEVLDTFMARAEFEMASPEVKNKFITHRDLHREALGEFPEGLPTLGSPEADQLLGMSAQGGVPEGQEFGF